MFFLVQKRVSNLKLSIITRNPISDMMQNVLHDLLVVGSFIYSVYHFLNIFFLFLANVESRKKSQTYRVKSQGCVSFVLADIFGVESAINKLKGFYLPLCHP